ncbi:MAG: hypothetical protein K6G00_06140 [Treponema sp.]|nr:hypothetical protein [Treponema sp.]
MKKKTFFSTFLSAMAVALVSLSVLMSAGCAQSAGGSLGMGDDSSGGDGASSRMLGISVGSSAGRTIYYDTANFDDFDKLVLTGKSARRQTIEMDVTDPLKNSGSAQVELAATYWELKLTASKEGKELMEGYQNVDLTNGTQNIVFKLSAGKLTTPGTVNIHGSYIKPESFNPAKYKVGLYKLTSAGFSAVEGYEETVDIATGDEPATYAFDKSSAMTCPPGTYYFKFSLLREDGTTCSEYSDLVIVNPGLCTEAEVNVENYINEPPAKPENFVAEWVESSASQDDIDAYYDVRFSWEDMSDNETYFKIILTEYDAEGSPIAHQTFPVAEDGDSSLATVVDTGDILIAGKEECTLRLPTGRLFDATIQSLNVMGSRGEVVRSSPLGAGNLGYTGYAADKNINLVRRVYNLADGTLVYNGDSYTGSYYEFSIFEGTDIPLIDIDGVTNTLIKTVGSTDYVFESWINDEDRRVMTAENAPEGCKDGSYTAKYPTNSISFEVVSNEAGEIATADISVGTGEGIDLAGDLESGYVATVAQAGDITITLTNTDKFEPSAIQISGGPKALSLRNLSNTAAATISTKDYDYGTYQIIVVATYKATHQKYSYPFNLNIKN